MTDKHQARIHWWTEHVCLGLADTRRAVDPSWSSDNAAEGWNLICEFAVSPKDQGNPSLATISFLLDDAPAEWLGPGRELQLFEPATGKSARVEILD
jgi:hypothetical protein